MKCYIAGQMRGRVHYNFPAFFQAEEEVLKLGFVPANPARKDVEEGFDGRKLPEDTDWTKVPEGWPDVHEFIRRDVEMLLDCEAIYMLKGWEGSKGARAEYAVAVWGGHAIFFQGDEPERCAWPNESFIVSGSGECYNVNSPRID